MAALVCDICGGKLIGKPGGVFECDSCGMEYSTEWAKEKIQEIKGTVTVEGTVEVTGKVQVDNSDQLEKFIELSDSAYKGGNGQSAYDYASKALEIDPKNVKGWIAKMKSLEYLGTLGNLKISEIHEAGENAIRFASDKEKDAVKLEVYEYQLRRVRDLHHIAESKMRDTAQIRNTYNSFKRLKTLSP